MSTKEEKEEEEEEGSVLREVRVGMVGEMVVTGRPLAIGYYQDGRLMEDSSTGVGFCWIKALEDGAWGRTRPGEGTRAYFTGDLAVRHDLSSGGDFEYMGRSDRQVKLNGMRVSLNEVENTALDHIRRNSMELRAMEATAVLHEEGGLLLLLTPGKRGQAIPTKEELEAVREGLRKELPSHMVPSLIKADHAIPLLPNGKIDRLLISRLGGVRGSGNRAGNRARLSEALTPEERRIGEIWLEILPWIGGGRVIESGDDFVSLGGSSPNPKL